jgi:hypothetical protein
MALNSRLKRACRRLHCKLVHTINASSILDYLFGRKVISAEDYQELLEINGRTEKSRRMLSLLHVGQHPRAVVELYAAMKKEPAYKHLIERIHLLGVRFHRSSSQYSCHRSNIQHCHKSRTSREPSAMQFDCQSPW